MKVNKYKDGKGSVEICSNSFVKVSCMQENSIYLGAKAKIFCGPALTFAVCLAFESVDGADISLKTGTLNIRAGKKATRLSSVSDRNFFVDICKSRIASCASKVKTIADGASAINTSINTFAKKTSIASNTTAIANTAASITANKNAVINKKDEISAKETNIINELKSQITFADEVIKSLAEMDSALTKIAQQQMAVGSSANESGTVLNSMAKMRNS